MFFCEKKLHPKPTVIGLTFYWGSQFFRKIRSIMKENVTICLKLAKSEKTKKMHIIPKSNLSF